MLKEETREQFLERIKENAYSPLSESDRKKLARLRGDCSFSCAECEHEVCLKSGGHHVGI